MCMYIYFPPPLSSSFTVKYAEIFMVKFLYILQFNLPFTNLKLTKSELFLPSQCVTMQHMYYSYCTTYQKNSKHKIIIGRPVQALSLL